MPGYTKLFSSIVASTVWNEDNDTRIVWITMLAMADRRGVVEGSIPGLAVLARVSVDGCRAAIVKLSNPDPDSRSQVKDGRRIEPVEGGWRIVNHGEYRKRLSEEDRREYQRQWVSEKRHRDHDVDTVDTPSTNVDDVDISRVQSTEAKADTKDHVQNPPYPPEGGCVENEEAPVRVSKRQMGHAGAERFDRFWSAYPKKVGKGAARAAWNKRRPSEAQAAQIIEGVERQKRSVQWTREDGRFIPNPATFLNQERWDDVPDPDVPHVSDRMLSAGRSLKAFLEAKDDES